MPEHDGYVCSRQALLGAHTLEDCALMPHSAQRWHGAMQMASSLSIFLVFASTWGDGI
jgi:hypothetical protein